jgi:hypothetical protein
VRWRVRRLIAVLALVAASVCPSAAAAAGTVRIGWVGDTVLGSAAFGQPHDGAVGSLSAVLPLLRSPDLMLGNLEQALSTAGTSKCGASSTGCYAFGGLPSYASVLARDGFDLVNLANNHANDYGPAAEQATINALARAGVTPVGTPSRISIRQVNGIRVAFLGFAPYSWASSLTDIPGAQRLVQQAAARADIVVVAIHAGAEGASALHVPRGTETFLGENRGDSRRFTHAVIDAGADLVVGSGPHVVRGVEGYNGRLIVYSTGNFAGYHTFNLSGPQALSAMVQVELRPSGSLVRARWIPLALTGPGFPAADPQARSLALVRTLSQQDFGRTAVRFDADGTMRLP